MAGKLTELSGIGTRRLADLLEVTEDPAGTPATKSDSRAAFVGFVLQDYIIGLVVTKHAAANTLDISAGSCYDPSSGKIISYAGGSGVSAGTLGASQWNQVYIYDNSGTATIEVSNNAAPPSTAYAGTARQGGTNSNRRWIGAFLTDGSSNIIAQDVKETARGQIEVVYLAAAIRIVTATTDTAYATSGERSAVTAIPRYVPTHMIANLIGQLATTAANYMALDLSIDGTNHSHRRYVYCDVTANTPQFTEITPIEPSVPGVWAKVSTAGTGVGPKGWVDVIGYRAVR